MGTVLVELSVSAIIFVTRPTCPKNACVRSQAWNAYAKWLLEAVGMTQIVTK
ncbi:MAG: hypothetical protein ABSB89_01910 [Candidatus Bathyarchaeia archaeon]